MLKKFESKQKWKSSRGVEDDDSEMSGKETGQEVVFNDRRSSSNKPSSRSCINKSSSRSRINKSSNERVELRSNSNKSSNDGGDKFRSQVNDYYDSRRNGGDESIIGPKELAILLANYHNDEIKCGSIQDVIIFSLAFEKAQQEISIQNLEKYVIDNCRFQLEEPSPPKQVSAFAIQTVLEMGREDLVNAVYEKQQMLSERYTTSLVAWHKLKNIFEEQEAKVLKIFSNHFTSQLYDYINADLIEKNYLTAFRKLKDAVYRNPASDIMELEKKIYSMAFYPKVCSIIEYHGIFEFLEKTRIQLGGLPRSVMLTDRIFLDSIVKVSSKFKFVIETAKWNNSPMNKILANLLMHEKEKPSSIERDYYWGNLKLNDYNIAIVSFKESISYSSDEDYYDSNNDDEENNNYRNDCYLSDDEEEEDENYYVSDENNYNNNDDDNYYDSDNNSYDDSSSDNTANYIDNNENNDYENDGNYDDENNDNDDYIINNNNENEDSNSSSSNDYDNNDSSDDENNINEMKPSDYITIRRLINHNENQKRNDDIIDDDDDNSESSSDNDMSNFEKKEIKKKFKRYINKKLKKYFEKKLQSIFYDVDPDD